MIISVSSTKLHKGNSYPALGIIIFYLFISIYFLFVSCFKRISVRVAPLCEVEVASRQSRVTTVYRLETLHLLSREHCMQTRGAVALLLSLPHCIGFFCDFPILLDVTNLL